jgi:hypothetical protein
MENLSRSGTTKDTLKKEWSNFVNIPFPKSPKNNRLKKIFPEFVQWDGHVAGIVSSFLKGKKVDKKIIYIDESINIVLSSIMPKDSDEEKELLVFREYKKKLDLLINLVLKLYENE